MSAAESGEVLLSITDLVKTFPGRSRRESQVRAVDGVSFDIRAGETFGLVGESGCGKSTLAQCVVRLADATSGQIRFQDRDITKLSRRQLRPVRRDLQMVFQDPYASLNPRRRVGDIVGEPMNLHKMGDAAWIRSRVKELFELVGLDPAAVDRYPHEFSGGQRQRIGIARALGLEPRLLVADEPVSALDVSIQAQVLNLLQDLQHELGLTYLLIAHGLGVVRHMSDRVGVMYLGEMVELADVEDLYSAPAHPYTEALLSAQPEVDDGTAPPRQRIVLTGDVPSPDNKPSGCTFHPRCPVAQEVCSVTAPAFEELRPGRYVACHFPRNVPVDVPLTR